MIVLDVPDLSGSLFYSTEVDLKIMSILVDKRGDIIKEGVLLVYQWRMSDVRFHA